MRKTTKLAWLFAMALAIFVVWLAADVSANAGVGFLYAVPIGLAAWWGGRRWGAAALVGCSALYVVGDALQPVPNFEVALALRLLVFAGVVILASSIGERLTALEHSAEELEDIQAALTPSRLLDVPDVDAAAAFVPSDHGVSGDFYLLTNGPDESTVAIVGDVVGHGPEAARLATFIRARFAAFIAGTSDPGELLTLTNAALFDRPGAEQELVSAACLRFRAGEAKLSWAVAGHPPPLRLPRLQELGPAGSTYLLGASADLELRTAEISLGSEEGVLAYTDGATDVRRGGDPLGLAGLSRLLEPSLGQPPWVLTAQLEEAILKWTDEPLRDDFCLLALRPKAA
jgi:serine phosphatase RsbU (regulator of sigma subunit)